ncbi:MAG: PCRF domain-containing protein, partial [Acidobacteriota bacterium]
MAEISLDIAALQQEKTDLTAFLSRPDAFSDPEYACKNRRLLELDELIAAGERRGALESQLSQAKELANGNDELAELAKAELPELEQELAVLNEQLFVMLTPKDPNDEKNVIVEIRAG